MTEQELQAYIQAIAPADGAAMTAAEKRQAALAKPPGSLGALETISIRLAGITGQLCPVMNKCRVAVFAADNGVVDEGVSCAPRAVTRQQAVNMTRRVTGMSSMAACFGDEVTVVDVGMAQDPPLRRHFRPTHPPHHRQHRPGGRHDPPAGAGRAVGGHGSRPRWRGVTA